MRTFVGRRPPAPIGWGSLTERSSLWRPMSRGRSEARPPRLASQTSARLSSSWEETHRARPGSDRRGFSTTPSPEPGRLPSDRPRCRHRSRPTRACSYTCAASTLHPFACREPVRAPSRAWWSLQATPFHTARLATRRLEVEKMLLPDICNRPTTRAPFGLIDSRQRPTCRPCGPPSNAAHGGRSHRGHPEWGFA
jgi:hypothetical protein